MHNYDLDLQRNRQLFGREIQQKLGDKIEEKGRKPDKKERGIHGSQEGPKKERKKQTSIAVLFRSGIDLKALSKCRRQRTRQDLQRNKRSG